MPSKRRTISELELIDEIIGTVLRKKTENLDDENLYEQYLEWQVTGEKSPDLVEADKPFDVAKKARRSVALQEMRKLRREQLSSPNRGSERDRIRRALSLPRGNDKYALRTASDQSLKFLRENMGDPEMGAYVDRAMEPLIAQEEMRRKMSPLMRVLDQRKMSRRDLFRMGRGGAAKLAEMSPAGQVVKGMAAGRSPLFVKLVKALLSRQFHF